ncbi:DUF427 domain-containing protein [Streptomyces sp. NPDC093228]|uniref:DUF427 domain-containing protein n=1 Tax=Streptomyces sp. NPDC093228 TaxID=3155070 RepID=UPI00343CAF19
MTREIKSPGPDHPITIEDNPERVVVRVAGAVIADTTRALTLREAAYAPVQYIPLDDVDSSLLTPSSSETYCPYKGDASYYSIRVAGHETIPDAVWTYEKPYEAVEAIAGHVAFYPQHVTFASA